MLATLIPFFLVAHIEVDESAWKYGPEYEFDVEFKSTWTPMSHDAVQTSNYTFVNLLCRPKATDILNCRLDNMKKQNTDVTNEENVQISEEQLKKEINQKPFEIKFGDRGIDYLIVDEDICTQELNFLKTIAELLSIGADLNGVPDGKFEATENSTIGYCNVTFDVNHTPWKEYISPHSTRQRYMLESLPHLNKVHGETIEINKSKNLDNCSCYATFYFGSYGESTNLNNDLSSHMISFTSHTYVSDVRYLASATKKASIGTYENNDYYAIAENISLSLQDIRSAEEHLPHIQRPSKTSIVANSPVKRIFSTI